MNVFKTLLIVVLSLTMLTVLGCSDSDDENPTAPATAKAWEGTWLSAGDNVAPLLVAVFNYDSVMVTMDANTVTLATHVAGGAWTELPGTYVVTESASGTVHAIEINYTAFSQEGVIEVISGTPDTMRLEVVQTVPDIGATPRTPETGFGSDAALGTMNIQVYEKQ
jgi:hypothetical protein